MDSSKSNTNCYWKTYNASDRRGTAGKASRQAVGAYMTDAFDTDTASFSNNMYQMLNKGMRNYLKLLVQMIKGHLALKQH